MPFKTAKSIFVIGYICIQLYAHCQNTKSYLSNRYSLERMGTVNPNSNAIITGLPLPPPEMIGDPFLTKNYGESNFLLYNSQPIGGIYTKLDVLHNVFYVKANNGTRLLEGENVKSFTFQDSLTKKASVFINGREFKSESGTTVTGFFETLYDGPLALFKKTEAYIVKANFNATLNVGSQDDKIKKSVEFYYLDNGFLTGLPAKSITKIFKEKKAEIDRYIKINSLNLKDERHLVLVFDRYNSLPGL